MQILADRMVVLSFRLLFDLGVKILELQYKFYSSFVCVLQVLVSQTFILSFIKCDVMISGGLAIKDFSS